ncbi:MAG TPA: DUF5684 domain-containing protein [Candidatus Saccharimonadales bacterium]|nr:DUF5684 domain-containing protein [Candidatus Saccharimonadales bacterium]
MLNLLSPAQAYNITNLKSSAHSPTFLIVFVVLAVVAILEIASIWKVYKKADQRGWAAIVPIYSSWVQAKIGGKSGWLGLLVVAIATSITLIGASPADSTKYAPIAAILWVIVFLLYVYIFVGVARNFGKTKWFGLLLVILPFIAFPIIGFGPAKYKALESDSKNDS